ncbi:sensor domain-containing diguanylate cyclase [Paenibacillus nanensis]|nr:sensor domain-containing diguanylate cyclase [Paenibacillus nanensis]
MNIYLLAVIYLLPSFAMFGMTALILCRDFRNPLYRATGFMFILAALNFLAAFLSNTAPLQHRPAILLYASFPITTLLVAASLHYWYIYTKTYEKKNANWYKAVFVPYIAQLLFIPIEGYSVRSIAFRPDGSMMYSPGPGIMIFGVLTAFVIGVIVRLFIPLLKKEPGPAKILLIGMILATIFGVGVYAAGMYYQAEQFLIDKLSTHSMLIILVTVFINMIKYNDLPSYEKRYRILFEQAPLGIMIVDRSGKIREASPMAKGILNLRHSGKNIMDCFEEKQRADRLKSYQESFDAKARMENCELRLDSVPNTEVTLSLDSEFMVVGAETLQFIMIRDITDMKRNEHQITYLAYHDGLTGLNNRTAFQREIDRLIGFSAPFTFILMDLDKFKQINDTYGHHAGDLALRHVADLMSAHVRKSDFVARFAGDEFVVLLRESCRAEQFVADLLEWMKPRPLVLENGEELSIELSVGVSRYPEDGSSADELYKRADDRMYAMKRSRRHLVSNNG